jgi:hypothetical protein
MFLNRVQVSYVKLSRKRPDFEKTPEHYNHPCTLPDSFSINSLSPLTSSIGAANVSNLTHILIVFLNDRIYNSVKQNIIVNFITQNFPKQV